MSQTLAYRMDHIHIYCTDTAASEKWLVEGMGGEVVRRRVGPGNTPQVDVQIGGVKIFLRGAFPGESFGPAGPSRYGNDHFGLKVENLHATIEELKRRGVEIESEPRQAGPGLQIAFVRGPDQVRVELLQRDG